MTVSRDPATVAEEMRERGESIKRRELRRAFASLADGDGPTEGQRRAVETLADRIVAALLASPERTPREGPADRHVEAADRLLTPAEGDRE